MRKVFLLVAGLCVAALSASATNTVIEDIITRSEYKRNLEQMAHDFQQQGVPSTSPKLRDAEANLLRDMIDQQLLIQKASDLGITGDTELVKRLDDLRKQMGLSNMDDLEKVAKDQGVSYEDFKNNMRNQIITQQVIQREVGSKIQVTSEETQQFYSEHKAELEQPERVRLSEILIPVTGNEPAQLEQAQRQANEALEAVRKGMSFEEAAKKYSGGPTAVQGGDLGTFKRGTLAPELEQKTFAMKAGDISDVIRTKQGFVILKVTEHTAAGLPDMKQVEPQIQEAIYMRQLGPKLREYLTRLREQSFIDVKAGFVDTGASPFQTKPIISKNASASSSSPAPGKVKKKKKFGVF
jgi:peptidyl-prolyl cis-trans isomerase SurA